MDIKGKTCITCREVKHLREFQFWKGVPRSVCKVCVSHLTGAAKTRAYVQADLPDHYVVTCIMYRYPSMKRKDITKRMITERREELIFNRERMTTERLTGLRVCRKCKGTKPLTKFPKRSKGLKKRNAVCTLCVNSMYKETDRHAITQLRKNSTLTKEEIPQALVDAKKAQLKLRRATL